MTKVVSFKRESKPFSEALLRELKARGHQFGLEDILVISTGKILVSKWVALKCRYGCSRYNTSWCCPPATPDTEEVKAILKEYEKALILIGRQQSPTFYKGDGKTRLRQIQCWKGTVALERFLFLEGYYKAFGLVGETCVLCKECSYPSLCKFPQERRPTVESFSIDMIGTVQGIGMRPEVARDLRQSFSYFGLILLH